MGAVAIAVWDFDVDDGGLVASGGGQWQWGVPSTGPGGPDCVWATRLGGPYLNDGDDVLTLPMPDLSGAAAPVLVVDGWWDVRAGDFATIEVDDGSGWRRVDPVYGYPDPAGFVGASETFVESSFDLAGLPADCGVRLRFVADASGTAAGWYVRSVAVYDGDATPPYLNAVVIPTDTQELHAPYRIALDAADDVGLVDVTVFASFDGGPLVAFPATDAGAVYTVDLPPQPPDTRIAWTATASDGIHATAWDEDASFRVFLAAPTELVGPTGRVVATTAHLAWTPPDSPEPVLGYVVTEVGSNTPIDAADPEADVQLLPDTAHTWTVEAVYAAGHGDPSVPLHLDVEVPRLTRLNPDSAWPGDHLRVALGGESLLLLEGETDVSFGQGVTVDELAVIDVDDAHATIAVDPEAVPGRRSVVITGVYGTFAFARAFEIGDAADRPAIVEVDPPELLQGATASVRFVASEPYAGVPTVAVDDDLVVTGVSVDGDTATVEVVVSGLAGVGDHALVLDDGARLWPAALTVDERVVQPSTGCSTTSGAATLGALVAAVFATRRCRRRPSMPR